MKNGRTAPTRSARSRAPRACTNAAPAMLVKTRSLLHAQQAAESAHISFVSRVARLASPRPSNLRTGLNLRRALDLPTHRAVGGCDEEDGSGPDAVGVRRAGVRPERRHMH